MEIKCDLCGGQKLSFRGKSDSIGLYYDRAQCRTCGYKMEGHKVYLNPELRKTEVEK